jgi:Cu2+-exporting ATPase
MSRKKNRLIKTTVINLEGIESVLSPAGLEKQLCKRSGIHSVETNFMTGMATVSHDSVTLPDIKRAVAECGYSCSAECVPAYVCKPVHPASVSG